MALDVEQLTTAISDDSPAGDDLEYDLEFSNLDLAAQYTPEKEMGGQVVPAVIPDWRDVRDKSLALFERTKDLRVAVHLANASLALEGFPGLRDGLVLVRTLLEKYWDTVHPQLDADDDNDPTFRVNAVQELSAEATQHTDMGIMLANVQDQPFVRSRQAGPYCLHDLKIIDGDAKLRPGDERAPPQAAHIDAAFSDCEIEEVEATAATITECIDALQVIESIIVEKVGQPSAPQLNALKSDLERIDATMKSQLARLGVGDPVEVDGDAAATGGGGGALSTGQVISGDITSRDDVVRMIDKINTYYAQAEPSSPVPMLLNRAKSLVYKSFMEIVQDLTPNGVAQAQMFDAGDVPAVVAPAADVALAPAPAPAPAAKKDDGW